MSALLTNLNRRGILSGVMIPVFFIGACIHLMYSPHHFNLGAWGTPAGIYADTPAYSPAAGTFQKKALPFQGDFELPENDFLTAENAPQTIPIFIAALKDFLTGILFSYSRSPRAPPLLFG